MKNFETQLKHLENLAERIKDQTIPLEEAVKIFEEGILLSKNLKKELEKIRGKVEVLIGDPNTETKPETEPFEFQDKSSD